jgi:hypothetical protein
MDRYKLVSKGSAEINSPNNAPFICELVHKTAFWHKKKSLHLICRLLMYYCIETGGELGIRTPGTFHSSTVFKTAAIDHSASSPGTKVQNHAELANLILDFFK